MESYSLIDVYKELDKCNVLCRSCHLAVGKAQGKYGQAVKDVIEIRRLHATDRYTQRELARMFKMSEAAMSNIVNFRTWKELV